jgi:hypothetical protein
MVPYGTIGTMVLVRVHVYHGTVRTNVRTKRDVRTVSLLHLSVVFQVVFEIMLCLYEHVY